jgi:hypothetical protein
MLLFTDGDGDSSRRDIRIRVGPSYKKGVGARFAAGCRHSASLGRLGAAGPSQPFAIPDRAVANKKDGKNDNAPS